MLCTTTSKRKTQKKALKQESRLKNIYIQKEHTGSVSSAEGACCSQRTAVLLLFFLSPSVQRINTDESLSNTGVQRRGWVVSLLGGPHSG